MARYGLLIATLLGAISCQGQATLYCADRSVGGIGPEASRCEVFWDGCSADREAVLSSQAGLSALQVTCDRGHCVCQYGQRIHRFEQARGCEALEASAKGFVRDRCGWSVAYLDTLDPEVQFLEDMLRWGGYALATIVVVIGVVVALWWRRRKRPAATAG